MLFILYYACFFAEYLALGANVVSIEHQSRRSLLFGINNVYNDSYCCYLVYKSFELYLLKMIHFVRAMAPYFIKVLLFNTININRSISIP